MLPPLKVEHLNMNLRIKGRPVGHTSESHESFQNLVVTSPGVCSHRSSPHRPFHLRVAARMAGYIATGPACLVTSQPWPAGSSAGRSLVTGQSTCLDSCLLCCTPLNHATQKNHPEKSIHSTTSTKTNLASVNLDREFSHLCLAMTIRCHVADSASGLVIAWFISHLDLLSCAPQPVFCGLARASKIGSSCSTSRETWHHAC